MADRARGAAPRASSIHGRVVPLGAGLLMAALVTDVLYWRTVEVQWETFSVWLITGGLIVAAVAGLALIGDVLLRRDLRISPPRFLLLAVAVVLSVFNVFVHSRDGYTAVVPSGLTLSAVVAVILALTGIGGWEAVRSAGPTQERL